MKSATVISCKISWTTNPRSRQSSQKVDYHLAEEVIEEKPELTVNMPFPEAIALAIKREQEAMDTYEVLAGDTDDEELRALFINLRNMEQSHKTSLEAVYMDVAYAEVW